MHTYVHTYIRTYIIYIHVCTQTRRHISTYIETHICRHVHICMCMCVRGFLSGHVGSKVQLHLILAVLTSTGPLLCDLCALHEHMRESHLNANQSPMVVTVLTFHSDRQSFAVLANLYSNINTLTQTHQHTYTLGHMNYRAK